MGSIVLLSSSAIVLVVLLLGAGFARSDLSKDRDECADKLVGLANCLPYVGGEVKTPTIDCCSGLKVVLDTSKKCICILIKDRDDPTLGFKINATLAVQLPTACHTPANISQCVDLLHLAPNSSEAKVFEGFEKSTKTNSSVPSVSSGSGEKGSRSSSSSSASSEEKSGGGGWGEKWGEKWVFGLLPFLFISHFFCLL
ncbi:PREDICTED: protein YLS3-like isoform X2 [Lupinus angustifolius]|uniref:protein YLS3-like isoform X2 n=1 Tax=Lupinus angustifolius TaxID=3871 RepID=UPI00092FB7A2|nr:PREDICTED: protein YLS3-like isoform X2 [Lupinus angustifolius]